MFSPTAKRKIFFTISSVLVILSIVLLCVKGLNMGIDFKGGNAYQFELGKTKYSTQIEKTITDIVKANAKSAKTDDIVIQAVDNKKAVSVKIPLVTDEESEKIVAELKDAFKVKDVSMDKVSATVSGELIGGSLKAILLAIVLMLIYITIRFDFQSGTSAVLALAHDVLIMLGVYSLFGCTVNTSFIAAILTIVGYSINATIIVFDRVRENQRLMKKATSDQIADDAIKSSYLRAINSSITTLLTIGVLYILGVDSIKEFALPIIIGIFAGTYSSLFIAGPFWAWWKGPKAK